MTKEEIQFMKDYIEMRIPIAQTGLLGVSENKICQIFIKILDKEGEFDD